MLVKAGANVNVVWTQNGLVWTLFPVVAQLGHVSILKELIKGGANVDVENADGFTALFKASKSGRAFTVKALLEAKP